MSGAMCVELSTAQGGRDDSALRLVIGVLTYRRPETLGANLEAICTHVREFVADTGRRGDRIEVQVLVVDNDAAASAQKTVEATLLPVRYVVEERPGIAAARNRVLHEACGADALVFIDDDEEPLPGWLDSLVDVWRTTGAAGVVGRVVPDYQVAPSRWIEAGEFFVRRTMPTGTRRCAGAAGNLLLDLRQLADTGIVFDEPFGLTGGEDTLMTRRMTARGLQLVWCNESVAKDLIPAERLTRQWVLRRAWSHGNNCALIEVHLARSRSQRLAVRLRCGAGGCVRIAAGCAQFVRGVARRSLRDRARGVRMIWRGGGVIAGACGFVFEEYSRRDGSPNSPDSGTAQLPAAHGATA